MLGFPLQSWRRVAREGVWAFAGQVSVAVAGVAAVRLLTELTPKEVFGEANLLLGIYVLGRSFCITPIGSAQVRFHPEYARKGLTRWFTREIERLGWYATLALLGLCGCGYLGWRMYAGGGYRPFLAGVLTAIIVLDLVKTLRRGRLHAERRQARYAVWSALEAWLWLAFTALAMLVSATTESFLFGRALGFAVGFVAFGVLWYPQLPRDATEAEMPTRSDFRQKMLAYGLPFVPLALTSWVANLGDRYIVAGYMGSGEVGLYAAASTLAIAPFGIVHGMAALFVRPVLFQAQSGQEDAKARKVFVLWLLGTAGNGLLGIAGFWMFGDLIAAWLLAAEYREGAPLLFMWVGSGYALYTLVMVLETRLFSFGRSDKAIGPAVVGGVAAILFGLLLVPQYGALGAAQAKVAAFGLYLIAVCWILIRYRPDEGKSAAPGEGGNGVVS